MADVRRLPLESLAAPGGAETGTEHRRSLAARASIAPEPKQEARPRRLLDQVRDAIRTPGYSPRTAEAYVGWVRRFIRFHGKRHPRDMGAPEAQAYLTSLATEKRVAASTYNQALAAILFLCQKVLNTRPPWMDEIVRARRPIRLPVVLSRAEVRLVLREISGMYQLVAFLMYECGLRLLEAATLRIKDLDVDRKAVLVRDGKGRKDRLMMLPAAIVPALQAHSREVEAQHQQDLAAAAGWVELPGGPSEKLPSAGREWPWQRAFPATRIYSHAGTNQRRRHHLHETAIQRAVQQAGLAAHLAKRVTTHVFRTIQELLGHEDVSTTMIYTHLINRGPAGVRSPADQTLADLFAPQSRKES